MYLSDFGTLSVIPNRVMLNAAIDPDYVSRGVLRSTRTEKLAKTGDAEAPCSCATIYLAIWRIQLARLCFRVSSKLAMLGQWLLDGAVKKGLTT
jgi:hypothetical protein